MSQLWISSGRTGGLGAHRHPREITRCTLEKRKIERELEENEDWFRERQSRQASAAEAERHRIALRQAEQRRVTWVQEWTQYALNSVPSDARRESAMEVHTAVQEALQALPPSQTQAITQRLVDAAVHKALKPWKRKQEIERALNSAMNHLSLDIRFRSEFAPQKQRAWDAAVGAIRKVREEASYAEMETAAVEAIQPINREYEHQQTCQRIVRRVYIFEATSEETEAAQEAVQKALAELPIGDVPSATRPDWSLAGPRHIHRSAVRPEPASITARTRSCSVPPRLTPVE
jgi:hypothetical protein